MDVKGKLTLVLLIIIISTISCISNAENGSSTKIPENWESINDLQGEWVNIERDSTGYLLYEPCDGQTPGIVVSNDSLILRHQLEEPTALPIEKVSISGDSITINTSSNILTAEFIFKLVEPNAEHILLKWKYMDGSRGKQVITKKELAKNLRKVENPCEKEKVPEYQFLPVEYD